MLSLGHNITAAGDPLSPLSLEGLHAMVASPDTALEQRVNQLRAVRSLDARRYQQLKRELPYVVCATFNPAWRRTEHFAFTEHFVIDLDHLMEAGLMAEEVRERLRADDRVAMCFVSPGGDGLKIFFRLRERCHDPGLYSTFYKQFARTFAAQHGLDTVADLRTSDVCRACFLSADRQAWLRPDALPVDLAAVVDVADAAAVSDLRHELQRLEREADKAAEKADGKTDAKPAAGHDPDADTLARIRAHLSGNEHARHPRPAARDTFVPQQMEQVIGGVRQAIEALGVQVDDVRDIQYGKKVAMHAQLRTAELNIFYGKRGFSVVASPKRGTSAELNALMLQVVRDHLDGLTN